jgi:hypothetical protein
MRRVLATTGLALLLGAGLPSGTVQATPANPAMVGDAAGATVESVSIMAGCGATLSPRTSGAQAEWQVRCAGGEVTITGWVQDTLHDGQCARVKAKFPVHDHWHRSAAACPAWDKEFFSFTHPGNSVKAYLYEYNA